MDASIIVAIIALAGAVLSGAIALYGQLHTATMTARREAEAVLARYREPLVDAAYELQSRLYNIVKLSFLKKYYVKGDDEQKRYAVQNTLYVIAQYFGWSEILRRDIQFLAFPEDDATRRVATLQAEIAACFLSHSYGTAMMIWSDEQRAIGERMIIEEHDKVLCMGYASFRDRCDDVFGAWSGRVRADLEDASAQTRLRDVQHRLCDLVETLDRHRVRYTADLDRA